MLLDHRRVIGQTGCRVHDNPFPGCHARTDQNLVEEHLAHRHPSALDASALNHQHYVVPVPLLHRGLGRGDRGPDHCSGAARLTEGGSDMYPDWR